MAISMSSLLSYPKTALLYPRRMITTSSLVEVSVRVACPIIPFYDVFALVRCEPVTSQTGCQQHLQIITVITRFLPWTPLMISCIKANFHTVVNSISVDTTRLAQQIHWDELRKLNNLRRPKIIMPMKQDGHVGLVIERLTNGVSLFLRVYSSPAQEVEPVPREILVPSRIWKLHLIVHCHLGCH